jgi:outer membrane receptor protein involved in Fe transport
MIRVLQHILAIILCGSFTLTEAQTPQTLVKGRIVDRETSEPIPFATFSLYSPDSMLVTGGIAELDGTFEVGVNPGNYYALVQVVSYQTRRIALRRYSAGTVNVGTVQLTPDIQTLSEVVISAERSLMEMDLDKRIFNVAQDLSNVGRTASEILDNLPSITVEQDGSINLRGSANVRILIDGKPSGLTGIGSNDALQTLQGNMIDRIEVVTNPSVRYEAEGNAGIINIILKKEKQTGLNAVLEGTLGYPLNSGISTNMNYRTRSINYFVNYGSNYRERPGRARQYQSFFPGDTTYFTRSSREFLRTGWSHNLRLGMDFLLNDKNTLTTSFLLNRGDNNNITDIIYRDFNSLDDLFQVKERNDTEKEDERNLEYVLSYERMFEREGRKLSFYAQYRDNIETEKSDLNEILAYTLDPDPQSGEINQRSLNQESEKNLLLQLDYIHPFAGKKGKFETGYRGTLRNINTDYVVEEFDDELGWVNMPGFTNNFLYDENIQAWYALAGNHAGKFSYELGLRLEYTDIKTELVQTGERFNKSYLNFFPSIHTNYHITQDKALQLSYSRRVGRPGFWDLNPFSSFSDPRNIRMGNPDLDPEFTDSYETGFLSNGDTYSFYGGVYYRYTTGERERISIVEDGITFTRPVNLSVENSYGVEANYNRDFTNWWTLNANANFFRVTTDGSYEGVSFYRDTYTWNTRINNKFSFWKKTNFQFIFFYRAPQQTTQGRRESFYSIDLGLNKEVMKGKGTLSMSVRDLFNTRIFRNTNSGIDFYSEGKFQRAVRQVTLSFIYRINQKNAGDKKDDERGDEEPIEIDFDQ